MKKKLFIANDAHYLSSGYGVYGKELLTRLHNSGKYEIAELACYCQEDNPVIHDCPWKVYPNNPAKTDQKQIEIYGSSAQNQFGAWRFNRAILDFKPNIVCMPPETLIHTESGYRAICNIKVGDKVMTHTGHYRKVTKTMKRQHIGDIVRVVTNADTNSLTLTGEHPVWVYKKRRQTDQKKSTTKIYEGELPEFVPAKDLKKGDMVILPINKNNNDQFYKIKISDYIKDYLLIEDKILPTHLTNCNAITNEVIVDHDFGTLIGYLLGDGCVTVGSINIYFGLTEMKFVKDAKRIIFEKFGIKCKVNKTESNCYKVSCSSSILEEFLHSIMGRTLSKKVPEICWTSPKLVKMGLIRGLFRSDGCYKKNTVSFTSVLKSLAYETRQLCADLNIPVSINSKDNSKYNKNAKRAYNVEGYGESAKLLHEIVEKKDISNLSLITNPIRKPRVTHIVNGHMITSIKRVKKQPYQGQVYNLEVEEDNSYVANWCVHNCTIRDYWMDSFIETSPYRRHFHLAMMPTVDSAPQKTEWYYTYANADIIVPYTQWAKDTLTKGGAGKLNIWPKNVNAGINPDEFYPLENKKEHQKKYFGREVNIVGLVMRNQKRKLMPDIMRTFRSYLDQLKAENDPRTDNTILYFHTSYPEEMGWDIPSLLLEFQLVDKVYFTYKCKNCNKWMPSKFNGAIMNCKLCNKQNTAFFSSVSNGLDNSQLNEVYNLFDIYLQYAIGEGFGMCQVEAGSCGIPIASVDYSAMTEICRNLGGTLIPVERTFREMETGADRVYPDNKFTAKFLYDFFNLSDSERAELGKQTRDKCVSIYTWDQVYKTWDEVFDTVDITKKVDWNDKEFFKTNHEAMSVPSNLKPRDFVEYIVYNVINEPALFNTAAIQTLIKEMCGKIVARGGSVKSFYYPEATKVLEHMLNNKIMHEQARHNPQNLKKENYLTCQTPKQT